MLQKANSVIFMYELCKPSMIIPGKFKNNFLSCHLDVKMLDCMTTPGEPESGLKLYFVHIRPSHWSELHFFRILAVTESS